MYELYLVMRCFDVRAASASQALRQYINAAFTLPSPRGPEAPPSLSMMTLSGRYSPICASVHSSASEYELFARSS